MRKPRDYLSSDVIYGKLALLISALVMVPVMILPFYPEEACYAKAFVIPSLLSMGVGLVLCVLEKRRKSEESGWQSSLQRGSLPVLFAWCYGFLAGAIPFVVSGRLSFIHALFESVSGWTTTGLSIVDVTTMPHIFLFHRSFMQYCGGLGFVLMVLLLVGGKHAVTLYDAEGHADRLMPTIKRTVQTIFAIYNSFLLLGIFLYTCFGMKLFDAVCHSMSALSTAGFTTQANSIGTYVSHPIEVITILLMLVGSTNFAVLLLFTKFKFKKMLKVSELRFMFGLLAVFVPMIAVSLMGAFHMDLGESVHQSLFGVVTVFTTTGYSTMNYAAWPPFALGLVMLLMIIGGSVGSTAGGIKLSRAYLLIRITRTSIKKKLSPSAYVSIQSYYRAQGKTPIDNALIADTLSFVFCYMAVFVVGTLLITLTEGCSLFDAMFEFASALGTVGISNGLTNANTSTGTLLIEMIGMALGRLEIFIVFIGVQAGFSKLKARLLG